MNTPTTITAGARGLRALVIVDVQNDFCDDFDGATLAVAGGGDVARDLNAVLGADHGYDLIVTTQDWHLDPGGHFAADPDYVDSWPQHCVAGTPGAQLHRDLLDGLGDDLHGAGVVDIVVRKGHFTAAYSGFEGVVAHADKLALVGAKLGDALGLLGVTDVDVTGIATDHCVRATALDAQAAGFTTRVLVGLTAGVNPDTTTAALDELEGAGVTVLR